MKEICYIIVDILYASANSLFLQPKVDERTSALTGLQKNRCNDAGYERNKAKKRGNERAFIKTVGRQRSASRGFTIQPEIEEKGLWSITAIRKQKKPA